MRSRRPPLVVVAALALLPAVAAGVAPATAAPPPEELCGVCGPEFEYEAAERGVPLTVEHSTATIGVDRSGTGHWHARVRIDDGSADRLAANATLRERVVTETYVHGRTVVDDPRNLRTRVENDTLVVDFDASNVAHRSVGGVVLVDMLDPRTRRSTVQIGADELRISGPNGTAVTRVPADATVENGSVVWRPDDPGIGLGGDSTLAFAPADGPLAQSATTVALVGYGVNFAGPGVVVLGVLPALALGGAALGLRRWDGTLPSLGRASVATVMVGGAAVVAAVGALSTVWPVVLEPSVARVVSAAVAAVTSVVSVVAFQSALLSVPVALWFPLGCAYRRDPVVARIVVSGLGLAPFGAAVLFGTPRSLLYALLGSLVTTLPWAAGTVLFGVPLYLLGRDLGQAGDAPDETERTRPASAE
ncbi:hypothetical protein BRD06_09465 [Halobacteriales archaeon QS_9_67_15]|nr:MAG: hypothetical protein BRD06_09465 [Halobacteriales archaeon QS_9_67_15]